MLIMGYGISMDVENLRFAVLDRDQTVSSRMVAQSGRIPLFYRTAAARQL